MKKTNRLMAFVIAVAMMASMMSFTATVSAESAISSVEVSDADKDLSIKLEVLGVITNEFEMSQYVTRGQMASIAAKYANVPGATDKQAFADVAPEHPYYGVINALYNMGVITGDENGNYNPDDYVTYDEALVFVINAVGHKPFAEREGGYPTGYHRIAIKHDMLSDLSMKKGTDKATLADIYRILDKGLTAATVVSSYYGDGKMTYSLSETETFLSENYKIKQYRGIITGIPGTRITGATSDIKENQIEINQKRYDLYGYPEFSMLGYSVDFYVSTEEPDVVLHIEETPRKNTAFRVDAVDLLREKTTETRIYYTNDADKEYHLDLDSNYKMIYNNQYYDTYGVLSRTLPANGYIEVLDNNNDGAYDILYIFTYRNVMVATVSSDGTKIRDAITDANEDLSDDDQIVNVYFGNSRKLTADSILPGDVISIVQSKSTPVIKTVYISRDTVAGKIESSESSASDYRYCINGEWYRAAADYDHTGAPLNLGMEGTFYLDMNGDIAYYERDMANRGFDIGLMTGLNYELGNFESKIAIRVYSQNGEVLFLDLAEKVKLNGERKELTEREDAVEVLGVIAGTPAPGENYVINSVYAITYVLNDDGEVTELYTGRTEDSDYGVGKLNVLASNDSTNTLLKQSINNVISYTDDTDSRVIKRINPKNSWVISIPGSEEIENFDSYKKMSFTQNYFYGPAGHGSVNEEYVIESYDIYSFEETEYSMIDIVLVRGLGGGDSAVSGSDQIDIIESVGTTVAKDGEVTPKLYMAKNDYALAAEVKFPVLVTTTDASGNTTETIEIKKIPSISLINGVVSELKRLVKLEEGMVIQYALNNDDEISALRFVSRWDNSSNENVPLFAAETSKSSSNYILGATSGPSNLVVGTIEGLDLDSRQMYYTVPDRPNPIYLYQDGDDVIIYDTVRGKATLGSSTDIEDGDLFVSNISHFHSPQTVIVFRTSER